MYLNLTCQLAMEVGSLYSNLKQPSNGPIETRYFFFQKKNSAFLHPHPTRTPSSIP